METKTGNPINRRWFYSLMILCCLTGCTENMDIQNTFEMSCWDKSDTLYLPVTESGERVQISPSVFFTNDYGYRNLYLKVLLKNEGATLADTMLKQTFMDEMGVWAVPYRGGTFRVDYKVELDLPPSTTQIGLIQFMRDDALCGIESAGFNVSPAK